MFVFVEIAQAGGKSPDTVVYVDNKYPASWITRGAVGEISSFLKTFGFEELGADELAEWMRNRVEGGAPESLVVMTQGVVPETLVGAAPGPDALIRRYLDAGGNVIWIADVPFYFVGEGVWDKKKWDYLGGRGVLGFDTVGNWQGRSAAEPAGEGLEWGLSGSWTSVRAVKPSDVTTVLAADADGAASAWTKQFSGGSPGFIRLWDTSITSFSDTMGSDLYSVIANTLDTFDESRKHGAIYLFKESDYYPLVHLRDGGLFREIQVSVFNNTPGIKKYELRISRDGENLKTIPLIEEERTFFKKNLEVPVLFPDQELTLVMAAGGSETVVDKKRLDEEAVHVETDWSGRPEKNPVDMGSALVPADTLLVETNQKARIDVSALMPGGIADVVAAIELAVTDKSRETVVETSAAGTISPGKLFKEKLEFDVFDLGPGRFLARLTVRAGGDIVYREKKWIVAVKPQEIPRGFGAYTASLEYHGHVPYYDRETEEWSKLSWEEVWRRGPHEDVVVAFPNGQRFVWWRGSSNVPFWASAENVGMTYEWIEGAWGRGGLVDCIEPLQDKECRFSRARIAASNEARAIVDWRYALIDLEYTIADKEWADERYTFYPDGFGVRLARGYILPMNWHEANEFIVFTPAGANPFDLLPPDPVRIYSPGGAKKEVVTYPQPAGEWTEGEPAVFRVKIHRDDPFTPVMAIRRFDHFIVQYDGWKVDGRYISPSYWGIHYPVTRGYPTTQGAPPGWRERPAHASLMAVEAAPIDRKYYNSELETVTWAWLIGNTDMDDEALLEFARGWIDPAAMKVIEGAGSAEYEPGQRGYVIHADDGAETIRAALQGTPGDNILYPVFILENVDARKIEMVVDGNISAVDTYRHSVEKDWSGKRTVVWVDGRIPSDADIVFRTGSSRISSPGR